MPVGMAAAELRECPKNLSVSDTGRLAFACRRHSGPMTVARSFKAGSASIQLRRRVSDA